MCFSSSLPHFFTFLPIEAKKKTQKNVIRHISTFFTHLLVKMYKIWYKPLIKSELRQNFVQKLFGCSLRTVITVKLWIVRHVNWLIIFNWVLQVEIGLFMLWIRCGTMLTAFVLTTHRLAYLCRQCLLVHWYFQRWISVKVF